ncbi:MAG: c-type cytochrome [Vicinamibacterales bacterium]
MSGWLRIGGLVVTAWLVAPAGEARAQDRGAAVYAAQRCALCHALDGQGNAKGPLDGVGTKMSADDIRKWIVSPAEMTAAANATRKPAMRAYPNLAKADLDALVAFLAAKKKP